MRGKAFLLAPRFVFAPPPSVPHPPRLPTSLFSSSPVLTLAGSKAASPPQPGGCQIFR